MLGRDVCFLLVDVRGIYSERSVSKLLAALQMMASLSNQWRGTLIWIVRAKFCYLICVKWVSSISRNSHLGGLKIIRTTKSKSDICRALHQLSRHQSASPSPFLSSRETAKFGPTDGVAPNVVGTPVASEFFRKTADGAG